MTEQRFVVGIAHPSKGVVVFPSATAITEHEGGYIGKNIENAEIPIPESLTGCPDDALVFITPAGLLAWECDGKLVMRFDHVKG